MMRHGSFRRIVFFVAGALCLQGCSGNPQLRASWYQTPAPEGNVLPDWKVAIVNPKDKPVTIFEVAIDRDKKEKAHVARFTAKALPAGGVRLETGELLVVQLTTLPNSDCFVPVAIYVRVKPNGKQWKLRAGDLPSSLSEDLERCSGHS